VGGVIQDRAEDIGMEATKDRMYKEIGKLFMENVLLRQALGEDEQEISRMATEVGSLRQRNKKLSATAMEQEENLIALNERLVGKKAVT